MLDNAGRVVFFAACAFLLAVPVKAQGAPFSRTVILLDRSGSDIRDLPLAQRYAWHYVQESATGSPDDEVYVIGVSDRPANICYIQGVRSRRDARITFDAAFSRCASGIGTDWATAFRLAQDDLQVEPRPTRLRMLVLGDLVVDNKKAPGSAVVLARYAPLETVDWAAFTHLNVQAEFLFADEGVRQLLTASPKFQSMKAPIYSVESSTVVRSIHPDEDTLTQDSTNTNPMGRILMLAFVGVIAIIAILAFRRPAQSR